MRWPEIFRRFWVWNRFSLCVLETWFLWGLDWWILTELDIKLSSLPLLSKNRPYSVRKAHVSRWVFYWNLLIAPGQTCRNGVQSSKVKASDKIISKFWRGGVNNFWIFKYFWSSKIRSTNEGQNAVVWWISFFSKQNKFK